MHLREPTAGDQREFLRAVRRSRKLHGRYMHPPNTPAAYRAALERLRLPNHESRFVIETESDGLAGVVSLNEIVRGQFHSAYLGYYALSPYDGRGLMREGLARMLRLAFRELGLHRVEANIQPGNEASIGLARSAGLELEGYSPRYLKIAGRWRDHERWALVREDWHPAR